MGLMVRVFVCVLLAVGIVGCGSNKEDSKSIPTFTMQEVEADAVHLLSMEENLKTVGLAFEKVASYEFQDELNWDSSFRKQVTTNEDSQFRAMAKSKDKVEALESYVTAVTNFLTKYPGEFKIARTDSIQETRWIKADQLKGLTLKLALARRTIEEEKLRFP